MVAPGMFKKRYLLAMGLIKRQVDNACRPGYFVQRVEGVTMQGVDP